MTNDLAGRLRVNWILWAAMLASTALYLVMLGVVKGPDTPPDRFLALVVNAVGLAVAAASVAVPTLLWNTARRTLRPVIEEVPDHEAEAGLFRDAVPTKRVITQGAALLSEALTRAHAPLIVAIAMSDAVSILGFVLAFLGHPPLHWVPLYVLGVLLLLLRAPLLKRLVRNLEAHFDAELTGLD
ncbi:MAG: hypothetical protein AAF447_07905 [Myxococcota bacterium]